MESNTLKARLLILLGLFCHEILIIINILFEKDLVNDLSFLFILPTSLIAIVGAFIGYYVGLIYYLKSDNEYEFNKLY